MNSIMNNSGRPIKLHTLRKVFPPSTFLLYIVLASGDGDNNNNNNDDDDNNNKNTASILAVKYANCILIESSRDPLHFYLICSSRVTTTTPSIPQIPILIPFRRFQFRFAPLRSAIL